MIDDDYILRMVIFFLQSGQTVLVFFFFYELQINQKLEMRLIEGLGTEAEDVRELILQLLGLIPQSNPTKVFYWTDF